MSVGFGFPIGPAPLGDRPDPAAADPTGPGILKR